MDYSKAIKYLYDYFYNKIYRDFNHSLDLENERWAAMILTFRKKVSKLYNYESIGTNFLIHYFCWQFNYWYNLNTKRRITLGWIIGPKALNRYQERNRDGDYYVGREIIREFDVDLQLLNSELNITESIVNISSTEESVKSSVPDDEARFFHCLMHTSLYNHRSLVCCLCSHQEDCKQYLKVTANSVYIKRGY